jgi:hypothetical protein
MLSAGAAPESKAADDQCEEEDAENFPMFNLSLEPLIALRAAW